jgi:hypothetical protein
VEGTADTLAVPSGEHTPMSEIVVNDKGQVKGVQSTWRSELTLECSRYKRIYCKKISRFYKQQFVMICMRSGEYAQQWE